MGLCLRTKDKCECIERCKAGLAPYPELIDGCREACLADNPGDRPRDACDYVENFLVGGDQVSIQYYAFDCDPNQGGGVWGTPEGQVLSSGYLGSSYFGDAESSDDLILFGGILALIAVIGVAAYYLTK